MTAEAAPKTAAVVLAAGLGTRFGAATKQLAEVDGQPLVVHAVSSAIAAGADEVVIVLGHDAARVENVLPVDTRVRPVVNPRPERGLSSSLGVGVDAVTDSVERLVVLLGDQPRVDPALVSAVLDAVDSHPAVRIRYLDRPGHPVGFSHTTFDRLTALEGDVGARDLLHLLDTHEITVDTMRPRDIDIPSDLRHAESTPRWQEPRGRFPR